MSKVIKEFKEFIMRGNVIDMAVGVVVGGAFSAIVNSLVNDVIMPVVGYLTAGLDFKGLVLTLRAATDTTEAVTINYGTFINTVINFLIIALCLFAVVKGINRLRKKEDDRKDEEEANAPAEPNEREILQDILVELRRK